MLLLLLGARAASVVAIFARAAVGFVLGLRIQVVMSRRLREPTCCVAFTGARLWSAELIEVVPPEFFSVGSDGGLRYAVVVLVGAFWWVSQNDALVVLVEVVFLFVFEFLGCASGTSCVPVVGWFASLLAPCVLSQMVVWKRPVVCLLPLLSVGCSGWWCFHMVFGAVSRTVATFVAKVPPLVLS
ncbi:hypothetical protein Taro_015156 [Colocasia esculenta]|uniref:Uncharacterized protein n=1 Tax=Colocasia esculenta TaxID=4460 RepID=A0A843UP10_COLES|nr:hypothetical protein [Colocasia esculenta]